MEIFCPIHRGSTWRRTSQDHCDHHTWPRDQLAPLETASELAASWLDHRKSPALDPNENADADFRPPFLMRKLSKKTDQLIALDTRYIKTTLFKKSLRSWKKLAWNVQNGQVFHTLTDHSSFPSWRAQLSASSTQGNTTGGMDRSWPVVIGHIYIYYIHIYVYIYITVYLACSTCKSPAEHCEAVFVFLSSSQNWSTELCKMLTWNIVSSWKRKICKIPPCVTWRPFAWDLNMVCLLLNHVKTRVFTRVQIC